ncbi:sulfite exporter family protein [Rutstroemia sp. NJR-2017a BBW]|nr:sulfite exporter family protein [Rutstroemia sp. NJR-2017a BBW]
MIRNRSSQYPPQVSQSRSYAPTPVLDNFHSASTSDAGSIHNQPIIPTQALPSDADDLPLSHRRALLHQSSILQPSANTRPGNFNSHQPRRQSSAPSPMAREQQLASWRASVAQDLQAQSRKDVQDMERKRSILWQERQQDEQRRQLEMRRKGQKERQRDERIRTSGGGNGASLEDLHRRMLSRMQEEARGNL